MLQEGRGGACWSAHAHQQGKYPSFFTAVSILHERAVAGRGFERNGIGGANAILGTTKQARARAAKAFTPLE